MAGMMGSAVDMAKGIGGDMGGQMMQGRMDQAKQKGTFGGKGYQQYMGMAQPPQMGQQGMGQQQGMDPNFQSLMQMLMQGQGNRRA